MTRLPLRAVSLLVVVLLASCAPPTPDDLMGDEDIGEAVSLLSAAQRRARAGQIRDAAAANGITQGWLLAGIADAETGMSQCHSELTWACMGPTSSDCGGGPVVAGAGDGPCSLMQGGLGMFQFDAGTYSQTLAREGNRILSIAGNVAAAVDFVIAMVIRSSFVSGVDNDAQAVAWINSVRVGNGQWDAWVSTVTRYYNGCSPSSSCWSSRYARYRDFAANVYNEMGADFWMTDTMVADTYGAAYVNQTFPLAAEPFELYATQEMEGTLEMRNTGTATWMPGVTFLGTTQPRDVASPLAGSDWVSPNRAATVDRMVAPGETGSFTFRVRAPDAAGDYPQFFNLVQEGVTWFSDQVGPPDDQLQIRVTSLEAPPCPGDVGPTWSCEGPDRVRCELGTVVRETCDFICDDSAGEAVCTMNPIMPTADAGVPTADAGMGDPGMPPGGGLEGTCSASPNRGGRRAPFAALGLAFVAVAMRRQKRAR
ncbi:MAG: NBR1-Ig-like domain-containing protein [Sandaracinaceae bacterium]